MLTCTHSGAVEPLAKRLKKVTSKNTENNENNNDQVDLLPVNQRGPRAVPSLVFCCIEITVVERQGTNKANCKFLEAPPRIAANSQRCVPLPLSCRRYKVPPSRSSRWRRTSSGRSSAPRWGRPFWGGGDLPLQRHRRLAQVGVLFIERDRPRVCSSGGSARNSCINDANAEDERRVYSWFSLPSYFNHNNR